MPPRKKKRKKTGWKDGIFILFLLVFLSALIPGAVWFCSVKSEERQQRNLTRKLEKLGEFTTITQRYRSVFYMREKKNFIQDKSVLFTADFNVQAGVDLGEGFDLQIRGNKVRITLPRGRIFLVDADDANIEEIMIKEQFSSIHTGDYLPLISEERDNILKQARESGVPRQAEERAVLLLRGILRSAGIEDADIQFRNERPFSPSPDSEENT